MISIIDKLISILTKAVIFLLPLFFLPLTSEYFEFNKQFLFSLIMYLALCLWLLRQGISGGIKIKINPLNLPIIIFLTITAVSAIFSIDRFSSFFGSYGRFSDGWLGLLNLAIFYWLIINSRLADSAEKIFSLLKLFFYSSFAVAVVSLLAISGAARFLAAGPFNLLASPAFNPAGESLSLAVFLSVSAAMSAVLLFNAKLKKQDRLIFGLGIILFIIILVSGSPREARLDYKTSALIAKQAFIASPILGSGPASFSYDFSLYRPAELNQSDDWQIRFNKSSSHFLEMLAALGLPAILSYLLIISLVIYLNIVLLIKYFKKSEPFTPAVDYNLIAALFTAFILLFTAQLFFSFNTLLNFSSWFFMGLIIAFWQNYNQPIFKEKIILLSKPWLLGLFSVGAICLILAFFQVKFFVAELAAASINNREAGLVRAVKLNPGRADYNIYSAEYYLNQARAEAAKPETERNNNFIQANISKSIEAGRSAVGIAPNSVLANETLAMIYRDVRQMTIGSEAWAARFFKSALSLEPTNPILAAELAKAYININDLINAEKYFVLSVELKPDYYEAKFGLAKIYLNNKKNNLALNLLNELAVEVYDEEIFYELGRYYFNHGDMDKAIERFKLILSLAPKHLNSLYSLAIAYEARGDTAEALKYYKQVLELNPVNVELENKIKELSAKK